FLTLSLHDALPIYFTTASSENYRRLSDSKNWELVDCAQAPALDIQHEPVRGGASLFKEQAACPFNAFARLRLGANSIDAPVAGFSAIERGNLLHEALAIIWRELRTQTALLALDEDALITLVNNAAQQVVDALKQRRGTSIGAYYAQLEQERLSSLLSEWLAQEKMRPAFKLVAIEEEVQIQLADLPLRLRIDRIDQLYNGELILIEYKT